MGIRKTRVLRGLVALIATCAPLTSCTVFNGRTLPLDAGDPAEAGHDAADANASDGEVGPPAECGCATANAVLCDDFESGLAMHWSASSKGTATKPTLDTTEAHCGKYALYMHVPAFADAGLGVGPILSDSTILLDPRLAAHVYARVWVYMTSASRLGNGNKMSIVQLQQDVGQKFGISAYVGNLTTEIDDFTGGAASSALSTQPLPRDVWSCVQWHVGYDATKGTSDLMVDALTGSATLSGADTKPSPGYAFFILQAYFQSTVAAQSSVDLWFDDLIIDDKPIGCTK
jgi:hypothetical protein